jgi:hypothetical protein
LVAARRLAAGFAFGLGLAARVAFRAGFRAGFFFAGLRDAAVFLRAVRETAFFAVRRLAALALVFLGFLAVRDFPAVRFLEAADRDLFIGSPLLG